MGWFSGVKDAFKGAYGKMDPVLGRILGFDKDDKDKFKPQQQYAGGSKAASEAMQARYERGQAAGGKTMREGIDRTNEAADRASRGYGRLAGNARNEELASRDRAYDANRRTLSNANRLNDVAGQDMKQDRQRLLGMADSAAGDYQRTANSQLALSQDSTQRQALAQGSRGGAGGLRAALAGSLNANQQAASQAQITNAQEQNQIMDMKSNLYGKAADVSANRANVYGQAASLFSGREDAARANALAQQGVQGNAITGAYNAQGAAGANATGAGVATRGQYLGAENAKTSAELGAAREYEQQRQQNAKDEYKREWMPLQGMFNAPA
jgi:hypothetical protein